VRSRSSRVQSRDAARDANASSLTRDALSSLLSEPEPLVSVSDGRLWHPEGDDRPVLSIGGRVARVVVHKRPIVARSNTLWSASGLPKGLQVPVGLRYESPFFVLTCLRRKVRREIMFAKRKAGFGKRNRRPRRTWRSDVSC